MRIRWIRLGVLLVSGALLLGACGGGGDEGGEKDEGGEGGGAGVTLSVTESEFKFEPSTLSAPANAAFTIEVTNAGTIEHDFTIDEANMKVATTPGQTSSGTVSLAPGTYTFYCSVPGHKEAGMTGTLTVS